MKIYLASSEKHVGKVSEDTYICDAYKNMGFPSEIATLKDITKHVRSDDVVILKSIWGYHLNHRKFFKEISFLKRKDVKLINDYKFIFWNVDKCKYFKEIKYLNVIPTTSLKFKKVNTIKEIREIILKTSKKLDASVLVIKPCVSENGYLTFKYDRDNHDDEILAILKTNKDLNFIAQPYMPTIVEGEISVILINGDLLYGVKRFPGILSNKLDPIYMKLAIIPTLIRRETVALKIFFLKRFGASPNICRVDFLRLGVGYKILEIELIDPDLYFRSIPVPMKKKVISILYKSFA